LARDGHVDGHLVRSTAVPFSDRLHVLLSPVSINALHAESVHNQNMSKVLHACKQTYRHTIIDAPRVSRQVAATLAGASSAVLIVFQLTVKDIHIVRAARTALREHGLPNDRIVLVANRHDKRSMVSVDEARKALGDQPLHLIANDYRTAVHNINFGRSLAETAPTSLLRRDIRQLIDSLGLTPAPAADAAPAPEPAKPRPQMQPRPAPARKIPMLNFRRFFFPLGQPLPKEGAWQHQPR
jgi:pilus assembly protein CpaE